MTKIVVAPFYSHEVVPLVKQPLGIIVHCDVCNTAIDQAFLEEHLELHTEPAELLDQHTEPIEQPIAINESFEIGPGQIGPGLVYDEIVEM